MTSVLQEPLLLKVCDKRKQSIKEPGVKVTRLTVTCTLLSGPRAKLVHAAKQVTTELCQGPGSGVTGACSLPPFNPL